MVFLRGVDIIMMAVLIAIVGWTFKVKHDSQVALDRVQELEKQIAAERIEIDLLKSDWSLLTSPQKLQELVERYNDQLDLAPMEPSQIVGESDLPGYRSQALKQDSPMFDDVVEVDKVTKTGSVAVPTPRGGQQ